MNARRRSSAGRRDPFPVTTGTVPPFDVSAFLASRGSPKDVSHYDRGESVFIQGDACDGVRYIEAGGIKLTVQSKLGKEVVVAVLGPGQFVGEGCLGHQAHRLGSATAITPSVVRHVPKARMLEHLRDEPAMADFFIAHMLSRSVHIEQDMITQLNNSSEKRLARALLVLARYGTARAPIRALARITPGALATQCGSTPERVTFLLHKFEKLGFIEQDGRLPIKINRSLLNVVLHD